MKTRFVSGFSWLLLTVFLTPVLTAAQAQDASQAPGEYRLGSGDRVKIVVFGHDDLSGEFEIDGGGQIAMPLISSIDAAGATARELEATVVSKLRPDYLKNPKVSVEVLNYRPFYILGEVNSPGSYPYVNGMTVLTAVAMAGGYTYRARTSRVVIIRAADSKKNKQRAQDKTYVLPGDVIEVPERFF